MGVISHKYKLIFVHIPKTAGSAITQWIKHNDKDCIVTDPHVSFKYMEENYPIEFSTYKLLCVVRNTYDRIISLYFYIKQSTTHHCHNDVKNISFKEFIMSKYLGSGGPTQYEWIKEYINNPRLIVYPFETIESLPLTLGLPHNLERYNGTVHNHYTTYYDTDLIERIKELFHDEINYFGYTFK